MAVICHQTSFPPGDLCSGLAIKRGQPGLEDVANTVAKARKFKAIIRQAPIYLFRCFF